MPKYVKNIGGHPYQYEVHWDKEKKKNVWKYLGRTDKPRNLPPLTNDEKIELVSLLRWIEGRRRGHKDGQSGGSYHDIAVRVLELMNQE